MGLRFVGGPYDGREIDHSVINKLGQVAPVNGDLGRRLFVLLPDDPLVWDRMVRGEEVKPEKLIPYERVQVVASGSTNGTFFVSSRSGDFKRALREARLRIHSRARTALNALSELDHRRVMEAVDALQQKPLESWPKDRVLPLNEEKGAYLLRATPELRAFVRRTEEGQIELVDVAREDALQLFLKRQPDAGVQNV
jgi:hypothetical protein